MNKLVMLFSFVLFYLIGSGQKLVEHYMEPFSKSFPFRKEQHIEIKTYIESMLKEQTEGFMTKFEPDVFSIENYKNSLYPYRQQLGRSIGYPPAKLVDGKISRFEKVGEDRYSTVYRAWIEVVQGIHAYGIYMVPKNLKKKTPLIVAIHGGGGNPEAICGLDTRVNYHAFGYEAVKRGYIVWAPGLAMFSDYSGDTVVPKASREILDEQLKLFGGNIIGLEIHKIIESTKTLIKDRAEIDADNVGMTGLSWGGFFTMYTTALCPFIKAAAISGNVRETKNDLSNTLKGTFLNTLIEPFKGFGYFQVMGMICPRPCFVQLGEKDGIFDMKNARIETDRTRIYYEKLGIKDLFEFKAHPGGHEFEINSIFEFFGRYLK